MASRCCCNCKQIVGRIAEEVKAESEQWTEMQEMLDQVRVEMEDLKSSRDLWQRRAIASELNLQAFYARVSESFFPFFKKLKFYWCHDLKELLRRWRSGYGGHGHRSRRWPSSRSMHCSSKTHRELCHPRRMILRMIGSRVGFRG